MSEMDDMARMGEGNRLSHHGRILGKTLATFVEAGRRATAEPLPDVCATCAFRAGSLPNRTAGTGLQALNTMLGIDRDDFGCHHGMQDGWPTKLCVGYLIAKRAPFAEVKAEMLLMQQRLEQLPLVDEVRAEFDSWRDRVDPGGYMDVYELASAYAKTDEALR